MKKMTTVQQRRAKEYEEKQRQSTELRKWALHREMTPAERYALGPTNTWHSVEDYKDTVLPLWCPLSVAWGREPSILPISSYLTLVRGGILETNYVAMHDEWTGKNTHLYVKDSEKTRDILIRLQSYPVRSLAWQFIKARLIQDTFSEGWMVLFKQINKLRLRLNKPDWRNLLTGHTLNIQQHLRVGGLIDANLMPPDLLPATLRLLTVWLQNFLLTKHISKGMIELKEGKKPRQIVVIYAQQQFVKHQKVQLVTFYISNLDRTTSSFQRPKAKDI